MVGWASPALPATPARAGARLPADHDATRCRPGAFGLLNSPTPRRGSRLPAADPSTPRRESRSPQRQEACPQRPAAAEPQRSRRTLTARQPRPNRRGAADRPHSGSASTARTAAPHSGGSGPRSGELTVRFGVIGDVGAITQTVSRPGTDAPRGAPMTGDFTLATPTSWHERPVRVTDVADLMKRANG